MAKAIKGEDPSPFYLFLTKISSMTENRIGSYNKALRGGSTKIQTNLLVLSSLFLIFMGAVSIFLIEFNNPKNISYLAAGNYPTIAELNSNFNTGNYKIYEVGYLLSEYIIETWSKISYVNMIKQNANIESVLGITTQQFEAGWKNFVMTKYFAGG